MQYKLYKHQKKMVKLGMKALKKHDHVLFGSPTGSGKSIMMLDMIQKFVDNGERILVICPYRKLVLQLLDTFSEFDPTLLMGTDSYGDPSTSQIIVASLSTLSRRLKSNPLIIGGLDKVIIDEAHIAFNLPDNIPSKITSQLHKRYWNTAKWLGVTATPITASGYRLEGWDHSTYKYNVRWLIDNGWLADFDYYGVPDIDVGGLRINKSTGDYNAKDMNERTNNVSAIKAVYNNYKKYGKGKKCLIFSASIEHAKLIQEKFEKKGVSAKLIHSMIKESEQKKILQEYKENVFEVIINVDMLTTGFDDPEVEVLFITRPVGSIRLAIQIWGRVLRTHETLDKVKIVDLCSVYLKCGLPDDNRNWNREKEKKAIGDKEEEDNTIEDVVIECRSCSQIFRMIDAKRKTRSTDEFAETTYFCPHCKEIADIKIKEFDNHMATKIKTTKDVDVSKKYPLKEIRQILGELIKQNTRANTGWGHYIHRECISKDKEGYELAYKGYDQEVYSDKQAWKRIMGIYNG